MTVHSSFGAAALVALLLAGCAADGASPVAVEVTETAPAETGDALDLQFDDVVADFGSLVSEVDNHGTAQLDVSVTTANGGRIRLGRDVDGGGAAVLPAFDETNASAAALVAVPTDDTDVLEPVRRPFVFGASFAIDRATEGSDADNGNNLMQRGLYADDAQYKIQLDGGVPSCRIAGSKGEVVVKLDEAVEPEHWFTLECSRSGPEVSLRLVDLERGKEVGVAAATKDVGRLLFDAGTPLAIGAKVAPDGTIPEESTDQFNGTVDGAFYRAPS